MGSYCLISTEFQCRKMKRVLLMVVQQCGRYAARLNRTVTNGQEAATSLVLQWYRFRTSTAGGTDLIPHWRTKILHAMQHSQKKQKTQDTGPGTPSCSPSPIPALRTPLASPGGWTIPLPSTTGSSCLLSKPRTSSKPVFSVERWGLSPMNESRHGKHLPVSGSQVQSINFGKCLLCVPDTNCRNIATAMTNFFAQESHIRAYG